MTTVDYVAASAVALLLGALFLSVAGWFGWGTHHLISSVVGLTAL